MKKKTTGSLGALYGETTHSEDFGIGVFEYNMPDNILLQQCVEAFTEAIKTKGAKEVLELLSHDS